ncbi:LOW QUALITY PROTEIN: thioredoxin M-type, chloroplastic [Citrus clementina]|uniref:LOW QUALITY PROTEIN: thioredoxin M-type, chloroplastic n=1 Tax=Citrus clementina TaxID=85681 RepID=UPI000CECFD81|nr:LOW QUALITY PROTEIN: thioredoxin M-type, chloroplastic [Citrus x clementina]
MREKKNISHRPKDQGHIFFYTPINTLLTCCEQTHTQQKKKERQRKMAMKNCFQVSSVYSTRAGVVQCYQPFSSVKKIHLPISNGLNKSNFSFTSSCSSLSLPLGSRSRNSLILCKAREAVNEVQVVTDSSWENLVISSENPVLVEFWAPWCGPCRMIAPAIGEIAKRIPEKVACFKLNTDDSPNIATKYGIRSIPTVLFFKNGEKKESIIGAVPKSTLSSTLDKYVE